IVMNKSKVFRILLVENFFIYFGSLICGIILGFFISRLLLMILMNIIGVDLLVEMNFSITAALVTAGIFILIFIFLLIQNKYFLHRHQLIDLLKLNKVSEASQKPIGLATGLFGVLELLWLQWVISYRLKCLNGQWKNQHCYRF